jgi:hypothetical protein
MTKALIVYESLFGNTARVAQAVGEGLREHAEVHAIDVRTAPVTIDSAVDLLVVGGPTHQLGLSRAATRRQAAAQYPEASPPADTGLREWLGRVDAPAGTAAIAFDTRLSRPVLLRPFNHAAGSAQRLLRRRGFRIAAPAEWFLVDSATGPLGTGELERARTWGQELASQVNARPAA